MSLPPLRRALSVTAVAALTLGTAAGLPSSASAKVDVYGGSSYGTLAKADPLNAGKEAYIVMCTASSKHKETGSIAAQDLSPLGTIGAATTKVSSHKSGSKRTSATTVKTAETSLLGGLVQVSAVTGEATATRKSSKYTLAGTSKLVGLKINDEVIDSTPKKNTKIEIAGIAEVFLNTQTTSTKYGNRQIQVIPLKVKLLENNPLGLPTDTIVVGSAKASIHAPVHNRPYGNAHGTSVELAGLANSGPTGAVYLPCGGSSSKTLTNNVANGDLPDVLDAGAVTSSGKSTDSSSKTTATTKNTIAGVDLFDGVVTADAVTTKATAVRKGKKLTTSSDGTTITGLKVNGEAIKVSTKETTKPTVHIAGFGDLYVHRAVRSKTGIQSYAVELILDTQVRDLPIGSDIKIGYAKAGVTKS